MYTVKHKVLDNHGNVISLETKGLPKVVAESLLASLAAQPSYRGGEIVRAKKGGK